MVSKQEHMFCSDLRAQETLGCQLTGPPVLPHLGFCEVFILNAYNNITTITNGFMTFTYLLCVDLPAAEHNRETKYTMTDCHKLNVQQQSTIMICHWQAITHLIKRVLGFHVCMIVVDSYDDMLKVLRQETSSETCTS